MYPLYHIKNIAPYTKDAATQNKWGEAYHHSNL